ncbi:GDP-mannose mannosyl hydrolase [compost metagenome]
MVFERSQAHLLDVYEHFYSDSVFGESELLPDTHYVVLGYQLSLPTKAVLIPPVEQHARYRWWGVDELRDSSEVHDNTRAYLNALR